MPTAKQRRKRQVKRRHERAVAKRELEYKEYNRLQLIPINGYLVTKIESGYFTTRKVSGIYIREPIIINLYLPRSITNLVFRFLKRSDAWVLSNVCHYLRRQMMNTRKEFFNDLVCSCTPFVRKFPDHETDCPAMLRLKRLRSMF